MLKMCCKLDRSRRRWAKGGCFFSLNLLDQIFCIPDAQISCFRKFHWLYLDFSRATDLPIFFNSLLKGADMFPLTISDQLTRMQTPAEILAYINWMYLFVIIGKQIWGLARYILFIQQNVLCVLTTVSESTLSEGRNQWTSMTNAYWALMVICIYMHLFVKCQTSKWQIEVSALHTLRIWWGLNIPVRENPTPCQIFQLLEWHHLLQWHHHIANSDWLCDHSTIPRKIFFKKKSR